MSKNLDLIGTDYPVVCIAPTFKGFICGHKNAGLITHFEISKTGELS